MHCSTSLCFSLVLGQGLTPWPAAWLLLLNHVILSRGQLKVPMRPSVLPLHAHASRQPFCTRVTSGFLISIAEMNAKFVAASAAVAEVSASDNSLKCVRARVCVCVCACVYVCVCVACRSCASNRASLDAAMRECSSLHMQVVLLGCPAASSCARACGINPHFTL